MVFGGAGNECSRLDPVDVIAEPGLYFADAERTPFEEANEKLISRRIVEIELVDIYG